MNDKARKRLEVRHEADFWELQDADDIRAVLDALDAAEEGLYRVYVELGEDTDGARNARELFGPMINTAPGELVPQLVRQYRTEMEAELDTVERERDEARHIAEAQQSQKFEAEDKWRFVLAVIDQAKARIDSADTIWEIDKILDSAPGDALSAVKAEVWDEGWHRGFTDGFTDAPAPSKNPYLPDSE